MSIGNDMKTIAEKLTNLYGCAFIRGRDRGHTAGYREGYLTGREEGSTSGYFTGREHAAKECAEKHFAISVLGSGTRRLSIAIPFEPDVIEVYSSHPYSGQVADCYKGFSVDMRTCGRYMGNLIYCVKDTIATAMITPVSGRSYLSYQEGVLTFEMPTNVIPTVIWPKNVRYTIIAVRYPDETPGDLLREQILSLPDAVPSGSSGTMHYYRSVLEKYISLEEWESLTAQKPNWNFVLE